MVDRIAEIELDKKDVFNHRIILRDNVGYILETIEVKASKSEDVFKKITEKWLKETTCQAKGQSSI